MKTFLLAALQTLLKALIGALNYEQIKELVNDAERERERTNDRRREAGMGHSRGSDARIGDWKCAVKSGD